jgi:hypothetical protein
MTFALSTHVVSVRVLLLLHVLQLHHTTVANGSATLTERGKSTRFLHRSNWKLHTLPINRQ